MYIFLDQHPAKVHLSKFPTDAHHDDHHACHHPSGLHGHCHDLDLLCPELYHHVGPQCFQTAIIYRHFIFNIMPIHIDNHVKWYCIHPYKDITVHVVCIVLYCFCITMFFLCFGCYSYFIATTSGFKLIFLCHFGCDRPHRHRITVLKYSQSADYFQWPDSCSIRMVTTYRQIRPCT